MLKASENCDSLRLTEAMICSSISIDCSEFFFIVSVYCILMYGYFSELRYFFNGIFVLLSLKDACGVSDQE